MKHLLIILISIFLLPISVYGIDWTVSYHMKISDGSNEFLELSVPENINDEWKLPNQVGSWECYLKRNDSTNKTTSRVSLNCRSKGDENFILHSYIDCDSSYTRKNQLIVIYPKTIKNDEISNVVQLNCEL